MPASNSEDGNTQCKHLTSIAIVRNVVQHWRAHVGSTCADEGVLQCGCGIGGHAPVSHCDDALGVVGACRAAGTAFKQQAGTPSGATCDVQAGMHGVIGSRQA